MAFNGSGTFVRLYNWQDDAAADINIEPDRMDGEFDGLADGLSNCIARDGQSTITENIPFNGKKITGLGSGSASADAATLGQTQAGAFLTGTVGGTANAITLTVTPAITAYAEGQEFHFVATATNTLSVTLAVSGLAAKALRISPAVGLVAGQIVSGRVYRVRYTGSDFLLVGGSPFHTAEAHTFSKAQVFGASTLTDGANIAWALGSNQHAEVTLGGNRALSNPTDGVSGGWYSLVIRQDATGGRTITWGSNYLFESGDEPDLSIGANAVDLLVCRYDSSGKMLCSLLRDFG